MLKEFYMKRAIELANLGKGKVNPNPLVGAVIVKNGKIIGEGYHACYGHAHAEVNAFLHATEDVEGAEMYVTLEPCSHYGKQPPCALKIIEKKIKKVYVSSLDPNPLVNRKGIEMLEKAGIEVETGILENETKQQNEIFLKYIENKNPFVAIKYAMTLDGKIATASGDSKWITNASSRAFVHELRNHYMAIMVGVNTVIKDDPLLNTRRETPSRDPIRFIIDPNLRIPEDSQIVKTASKQKTYVVTSRLYDPQKLERLKREGILHLMDEGDHDIDLSNMVGRIGQLGIDSILIEGGATLIGKAISECIADKAYVFIAPKIIGGKDSLSPIGNPGVPTMKDAIPIHRTHIQMFENDILIEGYFKPEKENQS